MGYLILAIVLTIPLYLLPGYLVISFFDFKGVAKWGKLFLSLCISLVTVPTTFIIVGNFFPFIPNLTAYLILLAFLLLVGQVLRVMRKRPVVQFPVSMTASPAEKFVSWGCIFLFSVFTNLPRVAMFVQGAWVLDVGTFDETFHMAQLVSVARTGIPPSHYFFPGIHLIYYYASLIYPAIMGNLPVLQVSLSRAWAIHAFIQIFAFLGLVYFLLLYN